MGLDTIQTTNAMGTGTRGTIFALFGGEIGSMLLDMRWALMLLILLVVADFRFGWEESERHYEHAKRQGNRVLMEHYRWHTSRAVRRTLNKLSDYIVVMLMCGAIGMVILEPLGIKHVWGTWVGAIIACGCELTSIFGHFFYLHGVKVEKKSIGGFLKALLVAFAKRKDPDIGGAVEDAFNEQSGDKEVLSDGEGTR